MWIAYPCNIISFAPKILFVIDIAPKDQTLSLHCDVLGTYVCILFYFYYRIVSIDYNLKFQVQITAVDELYVEQDAEGSVLKQIARVRLFFLGFLSGKCIWHFNNESRLF